MLKHVFVLVVHGNAEVFVFLVGVGPFHFMGEVTANCDYFGVRDSVGEVVHMSLALVLVNICRRSIRSGDLSPCGPVRRRRC